ncbi:hypothetical protein CKM354_000556600 [Cercospora kikuchii]|uniref:Uncharacterized protein n=1 Tax=Cercospora kikuchii TaxID=84275 RepID=A0A9P3CHW0_9PEZI|nr:uncharacterized protein CKM354_000556600 [Cercospora kikuchii]GIZ42291.1 hypothetical protein CKM354_000556600 [Cercospora kikuchii]
MGSRHNSPKFLSECRTPSRRCHSDRDVADLGRHSPLLSAPVKPYPTPPDSSPLQTPSETAEALVPVPLELHKRKARDKQIREPCTPTKRSSINAAFTPFHDIKKDIDTLIEEIPADLEDVTTPSDKIVVQRSQTRNSTRVSLFLYSPSKSRSIPSPAGHGTANTHAATELEAEISPTAEEDTKHAMVIADSTKPSLLGRARQKLKHVIQLIIPHGRAQKEVKRSSHSGVSKTTKHRGPLNRVSNRPVDIVVSSESSLPRPTQLERNATRLPNRPFPVITANESVWRRVPEDITSTSRKPLPIRRSPQTSSSPSIRNVKTGKVSLHAHNRVQSQRVSVLDFAIVKRDIALSHAPLSIKAAASLSVMAIAAGADFLIADRPTQSRSKRNAGGYTRRRSFKWMSGAK